MAASVCRAGSAVGRALVKARAPAFLGLRRSQGVATYAQTLLSIPETKVTNLENGFKVASEDSNQGTCTVGVWIDAGSRYESGKKNGSAYFVEHMTFKGTKKRPQAVLEQEVESMGAHLSAYTSREQTAVFMKTMTKDMPKAVEILADMVLNSSLGDSELEKERSVILQELQEVESNLKHVCFDFLHATAFQGSPLARTVFGTSDNIKSLSRSDLVEYINTHYKAPRMVLAAAGGVNHGELVNLAKQHFGSVSFEYDGDAVPVLSPCRFTGSQIQLRDDALPLAHVAIAVEGVGINSPDLVPLMVASSMIGSYDTTCGGGKNLSGSLARVAAEEKLCQSFQAFNTCYSDTGLFGVYFVTDGHHIEDMMHNVQGQLLMLCTSVTTGELERAKNVLKTNLVGQLNGTTPVADDIGRNVLSFGRRISLAEWSEKIDAVSPKMLQDVCYKYIYDTCPAVAAVGPVEQLPDYNRIRSAMYWLRL
ncbi:cytochrome b-c1 complex subunit 1, mitochondrial [Erpetoichthys calabaricus]|uniref:Cytochrome b-c1 complex subunit 1, mitochondrial n=1 Tax=Erpetoichthys calabaricus TaxID=27687 RepID=A0A8C4TLB7_ERPCA|nr:cytochrome b-c1 complex subunit 1, mitochondrial [Erpetoichthys calabaricus]